MATKLDHELFENYLLEFAEYGLPTNWLDLDDPETVVMLNREMKKALETGKPIPDELFGFPDNPVIKW